LSVAGFPLLVVSADEHPLGMRREDGDRLEKIAGDARGMALSRKVCPCCIIVVSPLAFPNAL
jgi:hypothetical protein